MSGYYLKTKEMNPFNMSDRLKMLPFRYKMYVTIVRKKGKTGWEQGTKMDLVHYRMTLTCLGWLRAVC